MPNFCSRKRPPRYRLHRASGQAIVTLDGRDLYLGKFNSAASREAYKAAIEIWQNSIETAVQSVSSSRETSHVPTQSQGIAVVELVVAYMKHATEYYRKDGKPTSEVAMLRAALRIVRLEFGRTPAANFGPRSLKRCREIMIAKGWTRKHINKQVDRIRRMFKWGVEEEMIPGSVHEALRCVAGLKSGRTEAREGRKITPVSDSDFQVTLEFLSPIVADMLQIQRLTGARPSEICDMRPGDINRTVNPWEYVPGSHKTAHLERPRVIFIGPRAQRLLMRYLLRAEDAYCFSPREAEEARRAAMHEARKTPLSQGNSPGGNRKLAPQRRPSEKYDRHSYGRAVRRAAEKAGVATWSPHRARHAFATEVRRSYGLEAAQVALGHATADVSQIYAQRDFALAAKVAREIG